MPFLSQPGLIPVKIQSQGGLITTQVNILNFSGSGVSASVDSFNNVKVTINNGGGPSVSSSYALSASYAGTASILLGSVVSASYALSSSYAQTASYATNFIVSGSIQGVDYIDFDVSASITQPSIGRLSWNQTDKTLDLGTGDGDTTLQIGQETVYPPVVNKDSINLGEGTLVMVDPTQIAQGNRIRVVRAISNGTYPSQFIVGILTENIAINQEGYATWFGYVRNLNIPTLESSSIKPIGEAWAEGNVLYPNPAVSGGLTYTQPTSPAIKSTIAVITAINGNNLTLLVRPTFTLNVGELNNVNDITTSGSYGDLFVKSGSVWTTGRQLTGSYGLTGSLTANSFTGSLLGTSSYASNAASASYVLNAISSSFALSSSRTITSSFSITSSYWSGSVINSNSSSFSSTSSYLNTLNQNVLITGSLSVGLTSLGATENTLAVGPAPGGGTGEGGQILLAASGGIYTSASMLDTYQNQFRILRGTNAGSDAFKFKVDLNSGQIQIPNYNSSTAFTGASVSTLSVDNSGNILTTQGYTGIVTINSIPPVNFDIQNGLIINVF